MRLVPASLLFLLLLFATLAAPALAQRTGQMPRELDGAGIEERLGHSIPTDLNFTDDHGETVRLATFFDGKRPVLLTLVYHECPMLCNLVLQGLTTAMRNMAWTPGEEYEAITVSFDPAESFEVAKRAKDRYAGMLDRPADGWHFLTGSQESISQLAEAVGFRYNWLEDRQEFAHPSALIFMDGNGQIFRYLYGVEFSPNNVRTALLESSQGKIGSAVDQVILYCFQYDPEANSYVLHARNLMKVGGLLTMLLLGGLLLFYWRRERRKTDEVLQEAARAELSYTD